MKRLILFLLILCVLSGDSFGSTAVWDGYVQEAREQVKSFMKKNNDLLKAGKKDELNYTYVYRPGENFEFRRPLPKSYVSSSVKIIDNEWFYDPSDLVPSIDLFNETLVHYNTTEYNGEYRQQFIIVLDVLQNPWFSKSLVEETVIAAPGYVGVSTSTVSTESEKYNLKINQFYDYFISEMNNTFMIEYPESEEDGWGESTMTVLIIAFATIEKTNIVNKTVEPNATTHLDINLKFTQMWNTIAGADLKNPLELAQNNPTFKDYKNINGNNPNNIYPGNPLAILASIVQKNISLMFTYSPADLTTCEAFLFMLVTAEARDYYIQHCEDPAFNQDYIEDLRNSARAYDYIMYDYNANGGTGVISSFFPDVVSLETYIHNKLTNYIAAGLPFAFNTHLFDIYNDDSFDQNEKSDFVIKTYYSCFFDLNVSGFSDLLDNIESIIQDFSEGNLAKPTPVGNSSADEFDKRWTREKRWRRFNEIVVKVKTINIYTPEERQQLIDVFNSNQKVLWDWIITKNYSGLPWIGVSDGEIPDNISDLVLSLIPDLTELTGDENIMIYEIPSTKFVVEGDTYSTNTNGSSVSEGVGHVGHAVVESGNDILFKFESSFCPISTKINGVDLCVEDELKFYLPINNSDVDAIGFFDIVCPVRVPYPMHSSDCCFEDATNPCQFYATPMPAFDLAAKIKTKKQDQIENGINVGLSFLGVYGAVKGFIAVSSTFARSLAAVYISSSTISAISDIDQLNNSYSHPLAGPSNLQTNKVFNAMVKLAVVIDLLDGFTSIEKVEDVIGSLSSTLLASEDIIELGVGAKLMSNVKKYGIPDEANLSDADVHISIFSKLAEDAKTGSTSAPAVINQKVADFYRLPVGLSNLDKSDNYKAIVHTLYKKVYDLGNVDPLLEQKITGIMNFLESEGKVDKFVDGLHGASDDLLLFFKNTDNVDDMEKKVKIWEHIDDAFPNAIQCVD